MIVSSLQTGLAGHAQRPSDSAFPRPAMVAAPALSPAKIAGPGKNGPEEPAPQPQKIFRMIPDPRGRMAGSVPVWEDSSDPRRAVSHDLQTATLGVTDRKPDIAAYPAPDIGGHKAAKPEPFGFGDLADMVNPLQHIPFIGHLYRNATGDEIKPISRIIGGGVFGGFAGAATGLAHVMIEHETGKSAGANALSFITKGEKPAYRQDKGQNPQNPVQRLAGHNETLQNLPGTALSFADMGARTPPAPVPEKPQAPVNHWAHLND